VTLGYKIGAGVAPAPPPDLWRQPASTCGAPPHPVHL